jgi:hypothetical protein
LITKSKYTTRELFYQSLISQLIERPGMDTGLNGFGRTDYSPVLLDDMPRFVRGADFSFGAFHG